MGDVPFTITIDGNDEDVKTDSDGLYENEDCTPGTVMVKLNIDEDYQRPDSKEHIIESNEIKVFVGYARDENKELTITTDREHVLVCNFFNKPWSM